MKLTVAKQAAQRRAPEAHVGHPGQCIIATLRTTNPLTRTSSIILTMKYVAWPGCYPLQEVQQDAQVRSPDDLRAHLSALAGQFPAATRHRRQG